MKSENERLRASLIAGLLIHFVFCAQVVYTAQDYSGALVADDALLLAFLPHYFLTFFLPPAWPSPELVTTYWWRVAGKLVVSLPASLIYGWIVGAIRHALYGLCRRLSTGNPG